MNNVTVIIYSDNPIEPDDFNFWYDYKTRKWYAQIIRDDIKVEWVRDLSSKDTRNETQEVS